MSIFRRGAYLMITVAALAGCESSTFKLPAFDSQKPEPLKVGFPQIPSIDTSNTDMTERSLSNLLKGSNAKVDLEKGFAAALRSAVNSDPLVLEAQQEAITLGAKLDTTMGLKDFQVSGDVYGGVEDVTDEIAGIALALNAERLIYDGGRLDARIAADKHAKEAAAQKHS